MARMNGRLERFWAAAVLLALTGAVVGSAPVLADDGEELENNVGNTDPAGSTAVSNPDVVVLNNGRNQSDTRTAALVRVVTRRAAGAGAGVSDSPSGGRTAAELQAERDAALALLSGNQTTFNASVAPVATPTLPAPLPVPVALPPAQAPAPAPLPTTGPTQAQQQQQQQTAQQFQQAIQALQQLLGQGNTGPQAQQAASQLANGQAGQSADSRLDAGRQLAALASQTEGPARAQAQQQALSTLDGVQNDPSARPEARAGAADAARSVNLTAGVMSQHVMGREVDPLLSQEFKRKLSGRTPIGARICGIASLAMLAKHLGLVQKWTAQDTKKYIEGPQAIYIPNQGTDHAKLARAATQLGFPSRWQQGGNVSAMKAQLDKGKPVIILGRGMLSQIGTMNGSGFTAGGGGKSWKGHFLMIVGYTPAARQNERERAASGGSTIFQVNDPDRAIRVVVKESALSGFVAGFVAGN
jgi:hypothetical protein